MEAATSICWRETYFSNRNDWCLQARQKQYTNIKSILLYMQLTQGGGVGRVVQPGMCFCTLYGWWKITRTIFPSRDPIIMCQIMYRPTSSSHSRVFYFFLLYFSTHMSKLTLNCMVLIKTDGMKVKDLNMNTHTHTLIYPSSLRSTLLHNLMRHHGYAVCIYSGLFVFAGVEFGWMAEVIPHESHFNHIQTSKRDKIRLFVMLLLEDSVQNKKGHDARRHNLRGEDRLCNRHGMDRKAKGIGICSR